MMTMVERKDGRQHHPVVIRRTTHRTPVARGPTTTMPRWMSSSSSPWTSTTARSAKKRTCRRRRRTAALPSSVSVRAVAAVPGVASWKDWLVLNGSGRGGGGGRIRRARNPPGLMGGRRRSRFVPKEKPTSDTTTYMQNRGECRGSFLTSPEGQVSVISVCPWIHARG
jgi:hypothetical protein